MLSLKDKDIIVWFSCGMASAVAAKKTIEIYGEKNRVRVINTFIKEEHKDNRRFFKDIEKWIGQEIEVINSDLYPHSSAEEVWIHEKGMSFLNGAPCTRILKKKVRQQFEKYNKCDYMVLGYTVDEYNRIDNFRLTERENLLAILFDLGLDKEACDMIIRKAGIKRPHVYELGFPNANCIGCVKATSPTYWNLVRDKFPSVFRKRAILSRQLGARLVRVRGKRIFLDELDPHQKGNKLKSMPDCGLFCEEKF